MPLQSTASWAALASSTVSSLITSSDSILRGTVIRTELTSEYHGVASIELKQVYVGWVPKRIFTISWDRESEAQPLEQVGMEYVFFLIRTGEETVEAAQIGRSFWPLVEQQPGRGLVTPYVDLLQLLIPDPDIPGLLGKATIRVPGLPYRQSRVEMQVLFLHVLVPAIKSIWRPRQGPGLYNYGSQPTVGAPSNWASCASAPLRAACG